MARFDGRKYNELRPFTITPDVNRYAEGSVLIEQGNTKVYCTCSFEDRVPPHRKGTGLGWVTAEYAMLPRANRERSNRDISKLKLQGRSAEIQRLIGRSLRAVVDFELMGETCLTIDCDVLQGDGGTRCASITGGFVAMALACQRLTAQGVYRKNPITDYVCALSTGIITLDGRDQAVVDLCYEEDSSAIADCNLVMTGDGRFVEIQGTGEGRAYSLDELMNIIKITVPALEQVIAAQKAIVTL